MTWSQTYTNAFNLTFNRPIWMEEIPTRAEHFLVLEQVGSVQLVRKQGDAWSKTEFMKITVAGGTSGNDERGLLGFAFHPHFASNRKYYVYYVRDSSGSWNILEERLADATLLKDAGKSKDILKIADYASNHNGGNIRFGPDGFLYMGTGDGGGQGDPRNNGQSKDSLLAKMLRIDVNTQADGKNYGIPSDNPYAQGGGAPEVWAYGLRNPYRWAFDPITKELWAADVGGAENYSMEEVDKIVKGANYGWKVSEGTYNLAPGMTGPIWAYPRNQGQSIIGGYFFRANPASKFYGQYIVGDFVTSNMWAVKADGTATPLAKPSAAPRGWGIDNQGRHYVMAGTSTIYRLEGPDWNPAAVSLLPRDGSLKQSIGCIFSCRPGSRLADAAFADGAELEILSMSGARQGAVAGASPEVPASLKAGMYILRTKGAKGVKPNLLMVK